MTQQHEIRWGALQFAGAVDPDTDFQLDAIADGTNFGNPEAITEIVRSLLTDGSLAVLQGWDNREAPIRLRFSAPRGIAGPALAAAEAAVMAEVLASSKSPLVWVPPAQDAATCVFDVVAAKLDRDTSDGWDREEVQREYRYYLLTLTCLPFARTEEPVVVPALPTPPPPEPVVEVINDCTSTVRWAAQAYGPGTTLTSGPTATGGYIEAVSNSTTTGTQGVSLEYTFDPGDATGLPYVRISMASEGGAAYLVRFDGNDPSTPIAQVTVGGITDAYFAHVDPEVLDVERRQTAAAPRGATMKIRVHEIAATDALPTSGSARQQSRTAVVRGSAPTQAALRVFTETGTLGRDILAYTSRNLEGSPALRSWITSSPTVTPDPLLVSGAKNLIAGTAMFIPSGTLSRGTHALMARVLVTSTVEVKWSVKSIPDSTVSTGLGIEGSAVLDGTGGTYRVVALGTVSLPVTDFEGPGDTALYFTEGTGVTLDEAWLFNLDDGALTWVQNSFDAKWIEIRSPELGAARPAVYAGDGEPGVAGVCIDRFCPSFGAHRFEPGPIRLFTVTSTSLVAQSEMEFYPRYHSHVEGSAA